MQLITTLSTKYHQLTSTTKCFTTKKEYHCDIAKNSDRDTPL